MSRRSLLLVFASFLLMLASAARADACSCAGGGQPCQAFGAAAGVFVGTVTEVRDNQPKPNAKGEIDWTPRVFRFTVVQAFSGVAGPEAEVATGRGGGDCGYNFRKGETYLVYAYGGRDGKPLATGICTRTRPASEASEDLEFLRGLAGRASGVSLDIMVARSMEGTESGGVRPLGGLSGAQLTVEGPGGSREVRADPGGRVRLTGIGPGTYKVRLQLPEELTTWKAEQEVTINDRGCASVFFGVSDNGRVAGKVSDVEGRAAAGVMVALIKADDPDPVSLSAKLVRTDEAGRYAFQAVPPGRYLIAVNLRRFPEPEDPTGAYPRTYYPGAARAEQAEAVILGPGEAVKDRDILLPPRRAESVVEGVVVWEDGSPVPNPSVSFRDLTYHDPGLDNGIQADGQGRFRIKGYQGQTLLISARSGRDFVGDWRRDGPMERSEPVRVTLANPTETVKVVITKLR